jgi:uncharacterized DUF497 family protein
MDVAWDPAKNDRNIELRGLSFEKAVHFDFSTAWIVVDDRKDYAEVRYRALGFIEDRLFCLVFTETPKGIRVISFRKANSREEGRYEQAQTRS